LINASSGIINCSSTLTLPAAVCPVIFHQGVGHDLIPGPPVAGGDRGIGVLA
jgi:hypothetical protein